MIILMFVAVLPPQPAATLARLVDRNLDLAALHLVLTMRPLALDQHHLVTVLV